MNITKEKYIRLGKRENIISILFLISLLILSIVLGSYASDIFGKSTDIINNSRELIFLGLLSFFAGFLMLFIYLFVCFKIIINEIIFYISNNLRNKKGCSYTVLSIIFMVFNLLYLLILFDILFSSFKYIPLFIILIIHIILLILLYIIKIITIVNKKKIIN